MYVRAKMIPIETVTGIMGVWNRAVEGVIYVWYIFDNIVRTLVNAIRYLYPAQQKQ
jgi:hypothetical protein